MPASSHSGSPPQWLPAAQIQRDLHWCLNTPALVGSLPEPLRLPLCSALPRVNPDNISTLGRLGPYYEQLWQTLLCDGLGHRLIAHDRQLFDGKRTLGALDLLTYDDAAQCYWHLELAAKFYLGTDTGEQRQHWLGPDSRDRLDRKADHLLNRQLPLIEQPSVRSQIDQWTQALDLPPIGDRLRSVGLMQGWLFLPWHQPGYFPTIAQGQKTGLWTHRRHWPQLIKQLQRPSERWIKLPKRYWLSPFACAEADSLASETSPLASDQQQSALMALCECQADGWQERLRVLLVSDQWPDRPDRPAKGSQF